MRCFSFCATFFALVTVLTQLTLAQNPSVQYEQIRYNEYQYGVVVDATGAIPGILLRDVNGVGVPVSGQKLTIVGSGDFIFPVETDENGEFLFDPADVGSYSVIVDNSDFIGSLDFKVTAFNPTVSALQADTGISQSRLILVIDENNFLRFAATNGTAAVVPPVVDPLATVPVGEAAAVGGAMAGGAGDLGMLGGALGVAGLATGIAALAGGGGGWHGGGGGGGGGFDDDHRIRPPGPVSVGARPRPMGN